MMLRATLVAAFAAALLPLAGTSQASCLDDFQAKRFDEGYNQSPKSSRWGATSSPHSHVDQTGPATFTVYGDALVSDSVSWVTVDWPAFLQVVATNTVNSTTTFVDCVAG